MVSTLVLFARSLAILAFGVAFALGPAAAQEPEFKQIELTEKQVEGFIAAQNDLNKIADKLQSESEEMDSKMQAELESIAKKNGFASLDELDLIAENITMVMAGIDPETGDYADPAESIKKEIEEVKADKSIPEKEKKQMLEEMEETLKMTPALEHPENVQIVKKYRARIDKALQ